MIAKILERMQLAFGKAGGIRRLRNAIVPAALVLAATAVSAAPTASFLSGGPKTGLPSGAGFSDGDITSQAEYHTPCGLAMDNSDNYLFVADRDNNAVRVLQFDQNQTYHISVNGFNKPVGVALDHANDLLYVLNRGSGVNGNLLAIQLDLTYGVIIGTVTTNLTKITNAGGITVDSFNNLYVTAGNQVIKVNPSGVSNVVTTVTASGASLQGIVLKRNGLLAVCDTGRNGILLVDPTTGLTTTNAGFHGAGDFASANNISASNTAKFFQPSGIAEAGDGALIVSDYGNHRVKAVLTSGVVTNIYGVTNIDWVSPYPGFMDGTVQVPDKVGGVAARLPNGVVMANDGTIYVTEDYYHIIRHITGTGFPLPPPPPPAPPAPKIGWFDYEGNNQTGFFTVNHPVTSYTAHNDVSIAIDPATNGTSTYYITGPAPLSTNPSPTNGSTPPFYQDGLVFAQPLPVTTVPDLIIKAVNVGPGGISAIVTSEFIFQCSNPQITGNNAALFTISDVTSNVMIWYTTDGTTPSNAPPSIGPIAITNNNSVKISLNTSSNIIFQARAFRNGYLPSGSGVQSFSTANFLANQISFGLPSGEPSSKFQARPGQFFYAPVTLSLIDPSDTMYSLQFNAAVTNGLATSSKIVNGTGIDFFSMLMTKVPLGEGDHFPPLDGNWYLGIPNVTFTSGTTNSPISGTFVDANNNLIGVSWMFRVGFIYTLLDTNGNIALDFDTSKQDLITYSIAHDTLFNKSGGTVVLGAYSFMVPTTATVGDQYFIQLGGASATRDGAGATGAGIVIQPPANSQAVTVTNIAYLAGDAAPFHWLNVGDFGDGMLDSSDVQQVFQSAVLGVDMPPTNSDLYLAMDTSGRMGAFDSVNNYWTNTGVNLSQVQQQAMYSGNDVTINSNIFGDGVLDVSDVYVTFRRSEDKYLNWWLRYWTNGQFVAVTTPNLVTNTLTPEVVTSGAGKTTKLTPSINDTNVQQPSVTFSAGDAVVTQLPGQTAQIQIPINANIFGIYPLRILGLNLTVHPLDGSPALTQPVQFIPGALGQPYTAASKSPANYSAGWWPANGIGSSTPGVIGNVNLGTLIITIPTNATSLSAYAIHFDKVSGSPNGIVTFPKSTYTGLVTLSSRTNSSYGDGIPDSWRLRWFGTIYNYLSLSNACPTGDGVSNWKKYIAGVDPSIPNDFPSVNAMTPVPAGSTTAIHWPSVYGKQYVIERSPTLFSGSWTIIATNTGTGTDMEFDDNSSGPANFYRVRILP